MKLDNEFEVPRPVDEAWAVLTDIERIAPCMPGAQLTEVDNDTYHGTVKVKVGPMVAQYAGQAKFKEKDEAAHRAVLEAKGKERSGRGLASALVTASLVGQGETTKVSVSTDMTISGPLAQFGRGAIAEVSSKLLGQFADNLRAELESGRAPAASNGAPAENPPAAGVTAPATGDADLARDAGTSAPEPEVEPTTTPTSSSTPDTGAERRVI
jgi:uncharacterized protein